MDINITLFSLEMGCLVQIAVVASIEHERQPEGTAGKLYLRMTLEDGVLFDGSTSSWSI